MGEPLVQLTDRHTGRDPGANEDSKRRRVAQNRNGKVWLQYWFVYDYTRASSASATMKRIGR